MTRVFLAIAALLLIAAGAPWRWDLPAGVAPPPVPADNRMSSAKVELGRRLFYDADLSDDGTMACAACHEQKRAFADGNATRPGVHGDPGRRNVPGLANVGWFSRLTAADPDVTTLEAQVLVPLLGERPVEMGMKGLEAELARRLSADACYRRMFARAFPERGGRIDLHNVAAALGAFERTMIALDSPYDRFGRGDRTVLSAAAQRGARVFAQAGCTSCHAGRLLTDMDYHRLEAVAARDPGLVERTGLSGDAGRFRTPSLRNVALTGPWWHDGSERTLEGAIRRHGKAIPEQDMLAIIAFLQGLSDTHFTTDPRFSMPDRACGRRL
ncbi:cytochrome c peroxidase [Sphingobium sp. AP50]|uniref:cytochrome-c peroxidase n=1 Tax=Sphingobium sp. AP50 TaxID=1884369 RepID=UPI0008C1ED4F|nr:cytochrome c peroxidase [Sphingobium sp. AP50]SEK02549.1 cytochrome c peroxidase [Sphingobium sp. AP50]